MNLRDIVEEHSKLIIDSEEFLWNHPETGYKEYKSSEYIAGVFKKLGYDIFEPCDIPGFYTVVDTGKKGPEILVLAELDSVICPLHKDADSVTGAVHACGHHAQGAAIIGVAAALKEKEVVEKLCGRIKLCCVPAEELIEIDYRQSLKDKGIIKYFLGKREFLHRGYFDGADIAFMVHASNSFCVSKANAGSIAKQIIYKGTSAHAGAVPWNGNNALYGAICGINCVNALRETFKDHDLVRFHPIITKGGDAVNSIPDRVVVESYLRAASFEAMFNENKKVNRALCAGALSVGANVEIIDALGYSPMHNDENLMMLCKRACNEALPEYDFSVYNTVSAGSTDFGDLSCLMPVVHPYCPGTSGMPHASDYTVTSSKEVSVLNSVFQIQLLTVLLDNDGLEAKKVIEQYKPMFSCAKQFFDFVDELENNKEMIEYYSNGTALIKN